MESVIAAGLATIPNLIIAVWTIRNYQQVIDRLLDHSEKVTNILMAMHPPQEAGDGKNIAALATVKK